MSDFGEGKWIKTRKEGKCLYCLGRVPKGEDVYHYRGRYDNEWQDYKLHSECWHDIGQSSYGGQWEFSAGEGEIPERLKSLDGSNQTTLGALSFTKEEIKLAVQNLEINNRTEVEEKKRVWTSPLVNPMGYEEIVLIRHQHPYSTVVMEFKSTLFHENYLVFYPEKILRVTRRRAWRGYYLYIKSLSLPRMSLDPRKWLRG